MKKSRLITAGIAVAIIASSIFFIGQREHIPCRKEFFEARSKGELCTDHSKYYAGALLSNGYEPKLVVVDENKPALHMIVTIDEIVYYDPTKQKIFDRESLDIKLVMPYEE